MDDRGKSDDLVVPANLPNNALGGAAEVGEGRGSPKGNAAGETRSGLRAGQGVSSELGRVRRVARQDKDVRFTALLHHVDVDRLRAAYQALRPKAAPGVDGVAWGEYGRDLEDNLRGFACSGSSRELPGEAVAEGVDSETGWAAAAARSRCAGGQDPAAGGGRGLERRLRAGLPRVLVWVSAGSLSASRVGCARDWDPAKEGELGARRGYPESAGQPA